MEAIAAFFVTLIAGVFAEATIGVRFNMPGIGTMLSVALMGAIIISIIRKKK